MSSSILNYLDIGRVVGFGLKCPECNGTYCRRSRWHSKTEKLCSEGLSPYRCNNCTHRFLARNNASMEHLLINGTAAVLVIFCLLAGVDLVLESFAVSTGPQVAQASPARPEASATESSLRLAMAIEAAQPADDPATRAQKRQEAVDRGDPAAMLQLGRDLAAGTDRPKDAGQAAKWVQLAAAAGNPEGMLELGRYYRDGFGVKQDAPRAYAWLSRAAAANDPDALRERDALVRTMSEAKLKEAHQLSLPTQEPAALVRPR